jgi:DNA repair exonuclease SbcCD ATPase subunit
VIRNIGLQHWRAYERLDLPITSGVTFFLAPNGVGKSSLFEAVRWGLLGRPDDRARGSAVRTGHESATVELLLELPEHPDVRVARTLKRGGATTFTASIDGDAITELQYLTILSGAWAADPIVLDSVIFGPSATGKATAFPVRDHLAAVFGIKPLMNAADAVKVRRDMLAARIKSLRDDLSATTEAIDAAVGTVDELGAGVKAAETRRSEARDAITELETSAEYTMAWQRYRTAAQEYSNRTQALIAEISEVITVGRGDPHDAITNAERRTSAALEESIAAKAAAQVRVATAASAADLLATASGNCPTCLRPLTDHERDEALAAHGQQSGSARGEIDWHEHETARARQQLAAISRFGRALGDLHTPVEPDHPDPGPQVLAALTDARDRLAEIAEHQGGLLERLHAAQRQLDDLRTAAADQAALASAAREDLVLEVAHKSLTAVADRYLTERVEPLATEISHRWKLLFGVDGLRFAPSGELTVTHADVDLALRDLSGAERATALLVTRLLLAASATRASTIWFDEPLEHLDPARRASVAQTLVQAAQVGAVGQILVTTYEEGLARRLAATAPDAVTLTYARSPQN